MSRHLHLAMVPAKASSASSLCSAAPFASAPRPNGTQDATPLARSSVPRCAVRALHNPGPHSCRNKAGGSVPAPEGAGAPHSPPRGQSRRRAGEKPETGNALVPRPQPVSQRLPSVAGHCRGRQGRRHDERSHRKKIDRAEGAHHNPLTGTPFVASASLPSSRPNTGDKLRSGARVNNGPARA